MKDLWVFTTIWSFGTEIKITLISQLWNLSQGFPIVESGHNFGTFWYLRHLRPPGLLENVKNIICGFLKFRNIESNILSDTPLSPSYTLQHPQDYLRYLQTLRNHPKHILDITMVALDTHKHPWYSTDMNRDSHFPQSPPWHPLTTQMPLRMSDECFGVVKAVPWGHGVCLGCLGMFFEFPGVFWGCWRVYPGFESHLGVFSTQFPSIYMVHL